jgi:hypothetical protein
MFSAEAAHHALLARPHAVNPRHHDGDQQNAAEQRPKPPHIGAESIRNFRYDVGNIGARPVVIELRSHRGEA